MIALVMYCRRDFQDVPCGGDSSPPHVPMPASRSDVFELLSRFGISLSACDDPYVGVAIVFCSRLVFVQSYPIIIFAQFRETHAGGSIRSDFRRAHAADVLESRSARDPGFIRPRENHGNRLRAFVDPADFMALARINLQRVYFRTDLDHVNCGSFGSIGGGAATGRDDECACNKGSDCKLCSDTHKNLLPSLPIGYRPDNPKC